MIRTATILAIAASAAAFQSAKPAFVGRTALHMSTRSDVPYYASTIPTSVEDSSRTVNNVVMEDVNMNTETATTEKKESKPAKKSVPAKKGKGGAVHKEGVFSPMVLFVKGILGDETLNKVRGKVISLHSDVIGSFVDTSESAFGDAVLRSLFRLADKDGSGTICKEELQVAFKSLGFTWLQDKQIDGIFQRADEDGNGAIDMEEWVKEAPRTLRTNLVKLAKKNGGDMGLLV